MVIKGGTYMQKLTKEQGIILTGFTGIMCVEFYEFHTACERKLGRPIWTHQFPSLQEEIKEAFREDFMAILSMGEENENN